MQFDPITFHVQPRYQPLYPYQRLGVGVGLLVHDELRHLVVTTVGGDVQRRQVVVGDVVHRHVVVEQELDTVQVVPLSGHVERRQTVLQVEERGKDREREKRQKTGTNTRRRTHRHMDRHRKLGVAKPCTEDCEGSYRSIVITRPLQQCLFCYTGRPGGQTVALRSGDRLFWRGRTHVMETMRQHYNRSLLSDWLTDVK